jgi:uroporphyrinogen decarboxylase
MTKTQWETLLKIIDGEVLDPLPVGFLVDGPWVAGINEHALMDYFTSSRIWLEANLEAVRRFPDVLWLPGFWAEFGMVSNPPSFGGKCVWPEAGFPTCETVLRGYEDIARLQLPDVRTDGLLPFIIKRLQQNQPAIQASGHHLRFATSHGPLTIASYLLGHTEFFMGMRLEPAAIRQLLGTVTEFVINWLVYQKEMFPTIDGVLVLEDMMGFLGPDDSRTFAVPYLTEIFAALDVSIRFLHNDAEGRITAGYLNAMKVNLFNFSFMHDVGEIRQLAGETVTLMGNIPPRDVLALGSPEDIAEHVTDLLDRLTDRRRFIVSAGGFTPNQFSASKISAFRQAVAQAGSR